MPSLTCQFFTSVKTNLYSHQYASTAIYRQKNTKQLWA